MLVVRLLASGTKRSAFQSTAILRLPTPRKPPKSMMAARGLPSPSTMTSAMRPMASLPVLRTSPPRMPCTSRLPSTVTEGGLGVLFGGRRGRAGSAPSPAAPGEGDRKHREPGP